MKSKLLLEHPERTWVLVFATGDEVISELITFAWQNGPAGTCFSGVGAFSVAVLGWFGWEDNQYHRIPVSQQVELLSLAGDVARSEGGPAIHAHAVIGRSDGIAMGGHLLEAHVRPTLELVLTESPRALVPGASQRSRRSVIGRPSRGAEHRSDPLLSAMPLLSRNAATSSVIRTRPRRCGNSNVRYFVAVFIPSV